MRLSSVVIGFAATLLFARKLFNNYGWSCDFYLNIPESTNRQLSLAFKQSQVVPTLVRW
jgi:hypothetical protein